MKVKFIKTQTQETDTTKEIKVSLAGSINGVDVKVVVSGDEEDMQKFMDALNLKNYGEMVDLELTNKQSSIKDYSEVEEWK